MTSRAFEVRLNELLVGELAEAADARIGFRFAQSYLDQARRPVLGQAFEDDLTKTYWGKRPGQLPTFFWNLLPEGAFRDVVMANLEPAPSDDLDLLAALGGDLPGAVIVRPGEHRSLEPPAHDPPTSASDHSDSGLRFSLAGAQLKFSMLKTEDRFIVPAHDQRGDWILKVSRGGEFTGLVENEHAMLEWARLIGLEVLGVEIVESEAMAALVPYLGETKRALGIQRFDRERGRRIHQEDFAQVLSVPPVPPERKYASTTETLARLVLAMTGQDGFEDLVRRLAFVLGTGNHDAHLKNWSLIYRDGVRPQLAPLYDQVSTVAWPKFVKELALKLPGAKKFGEVGLAAFGELGRRVTGDAERTSSIAAQTCKDMVAAWQELRDRTELPEDHVNALKAHWSRVPMLRSIGSL